MAQRRVPRLTSLRGFTKSSVPTIENNSDDEIRLVEALLRKGANTAIVMWLALLFLVHWLVRSSHFEYLHGTERNANIVAAMTLFVTNLSRFLPLALRENDVDSIRTGIMSASITCQVICMASVSMMAFLPTPVLVDNVTGVRVHMTRWAEWTALAFLMTFMTEAIDLPNYKKGGPAHVWKHSLSIALSTVCGVMLPFCQSMYSFVAVVMFSLLFYSSIFVRLYERRQRFNQTKHGGSVEDRESQDRVRISLRLLETCAVLWTLLVVMRLTCFPLFLYAPRGTIWSSPALPAIIEACFEITSKVWYMHLTVQVHDMVCDKTGRVTRRLEELRNMMTVIWANSSDIVVLIVGGQDRVNAVVSPKFLQMERKMHTATTIHNHEDSTSSADEMEFDDERKVALVFGFKTNSRSGDFSLSTMDLSKPITRIDIENIETDGGDGYMEGCHFSRLPFKKCKNVVAMAKLLKKAWRSKAQESLILQDFYGVNPMGMQEEKKIKFEAKASKLDSKAIIVFLRDISERIHVDETEKQLLIELNERKMSEKAHKFARQEVRNGLLAAIDVVGTVRCIIDKESTVTNRSVSLQNKSVLNVDGSLSPTDFTQSIHKLDSTLREMLDNCLSEALARNVIHDVYESRPERIEIKSLLSYIQNQSSQNGQIFTLSTTPNPFPPVTLDSQLLRHIHRHAVSNARRYGKLGGNIDTNVTYDAEKTKFQMEVINLPGEGHAHLLLLSDEEISTIFSEGTRLHSRFETKDQRGSQPKNVDPLGDGAWIMQKCAKLLNGSCKIVFEPEQTIFSLTTFEHS